MHKRTDLRVFYFGTPVVLITTRNPDGSTNIAPMSSAWWLGNSCVLGMGNASRTTANLVRERECVLNLPSAAQAEPVDRIALLTGSPEIPRHKLDRGYEYEPDKFTAAGLTAQPAELVGADRILECPIQLECRLTQVHPFHRTGVDASALQVETLRTHIEETLLLPGTDYVDPKRWDPLIMKFCEFFGQARDVHPSRLASGWRMPHRLSGTGGEHWSTLEA